MPSSSVRVTGNAAPATAWARRRRSRRSGGERRRGGRARRPAEPQAATAASRTQRGGRGRARRAACGGGACVHGISGCDGWAGTNDPSLRGRRRGVRRWIARIACPFSRRSSNDRRVGDRTSAPGGAVTVAGLCRNRTGFATVRVECGGTPGVSLPVVAVLTVWRVEHELLFQERARPHAVAREPRCRTERAKILRICVRARVGGCDDDHRGQRLVDRELRLAAQVARRAPDDVAETAERVERTVTAILEHATDDASSG